MGIHNKRGSYTGNWLSHAPKVARLALQGYKTYKGFTKQTHRRRGTTIGTSEKDIANTYRYKPMRRRMRRRFKKRYRIQRAGFLKRLGSRNLVIRDAWQATSSVDAQAWTEAHVYSACGAAAAAGNQACNDMAALYDTLTSTTPENLDQKLHLKSAQVDLTITNTGSNTCEMDLYYFIARNHDMGNQTGSTVYNMLDARFTNANTLQQSSGRLDKIILGTTPFDIPNIGQYIKITSVKRIYLGQGNSTFVILKDPKNRLLTREKWQTQGPLRKGWTRGVLIRFRGVPEQGASPQTSAATLNFNSQRTYHYVRDSVAIPETGYKG